jgi:hypothetical protein
MRGAKKSKSETAEKKTKKKRSSPSVPLEGNFQQQQLSQPPPQRHVISLTIDPESPTKN